MGYIIRPVSKESEKERKQILEIAAKLFKNADEATIRRYLKELEKKGYFICRMIRV